jgi:hypothetical protein
VAVLPLPKGSWMSKGTSLDLNSEQHLASIPTAQGGLSRLAIARLKSAGVPVVPLLRRVGLTPEVIADPEERLTVRSQTRFWTSRRLLCTMTVLASRWLAISIRAHSGCFTMSTRFSASPKVCEDVLNSRAQLAYITSSIG